MTVQIVGDPIATERELILKTAIDALSECDLAGKTTLTPDEQQDLIVGICLATKWSLAAIPEFLRDLYYSAARLPHKARAMRAPSISKLLDALEQELMKDV